MNLEQNDSISNRLGAHSDVNESSENKQYSAGIPDEDAVPKSCRPPSPASSSTTGARMEETELKLDRPANTVEPLKGDDQKCRKRKALSALSENVAEPSVADATPTEERLPELFQSDAIRKSLLCGQVSKEFAQHRLNSDAADNGRRDSGYATVISQESFGSPVHLTPMGGQRFRSHGSLLKSTNDLLKGFRMNSNNTACFSEDEPSIPVRHIDSFDSVIDTSKKHESLVSASYGEKSSGIDVTCSTSPTKQIAHTCWHVFQDNYCFNKSREMGYKVPPNYMDRQACLDQDMRAVLVDWLVDVSQEFKFSQETLHTAVKMVDRFLSSFSVKKEKLQLVGTVAMMIASKYQEIYPPKVNDFIAITDDAYSRGQMLKMERIILMTTNFNIHPPTITEFIATYAYVAKTSRRTHCLAQFFGDLILVEYEFVSNLPSLMGAAAIWLALGVCESDWQNDELQSFSGYGVIDTLPIMERLLTLWRKPLNANLTAVRLKYTSDEWLSVALIQPPRSLPL